jgi:hypothetical protein
MAVRRIPGFYTADQDLKEVPCPKGAIRTQPGVSTPGNPPPLAPRPEGAPEKPGPFLAFFLFKTEAMAFVKVRSKTDARYILSTF